MVSSDAGTDPPSAAGPVVADAAVTFDLPDPDRGLAGVRLWQEVGIPAQALDFAWSAGRWRLRLDRPAVARMEYLLVLSQPDGRTEQVLDPANPRTVPGAFGPRSVVEFPDYRAPGWLAGAGPAEGAGDGVPIQVTSRTLGAVIRSSLWSPAGLDVAAPTPLLVAHDGPEYAALSRLTGYLRALTGRRRLPRLRALLLDPGPRNDWYSANPSYARALCLAVVPKVRRRHPTTAVVGMGASLGGLAMLYGHRRHPRTFDALFLQSGSFFRDQLDPQERAFRHFGRIATFVSEVLRGGGRRPIPATLTCGSVEENLANNRLMARALAAQRYDTALHEVPDAHNYTAWRDAFDPYLTDLLNRVAST